MRKFLYLTALIILQLYNKGNTIFWAIIACLLWSTAYAGIKIGLQYDTPFHFAGVRFIISGLIILPFAMREARYFRTILENWKVLTLITFLQMIVNYAFFYHGLDLVPGALGAVIVGSQPLVTAVVASLMHEEEKLTGNKVLTIISGVGGVILISAGRQAFRFGTISELLGVLMILIANIGVASSNVVVALKGKSLNPLVISSFSLFSGGIILYLLSLAVEGVHKVTYPREYWIDLSWLGFMAAAAFSIWFRLLQRPGVKVSELNLFKFIIPVVGAILSWIMVPDENPEWITVTGMIIITLSLILFYRSSGAAVKKTVET